ncbi:MAG: HEAT repeat domain-containing protein [Polyangiaceae bacterium]|nr:HEAT repeat domain-containing protein [Polyangiaceae bacterium]
MVSTRSEARQGAIVAALGALGDANTEELIEGLLALGAPVVGELLEAVESGARLGRDDADYRDVMPEYQACLVALARDFPDAFAEALERSPARADHHSVLAALGACPSDRVVPTLVAKLRDRAGSTRSVALRALLERDAPEVRPLLDKLLRDRDSSVVFLAIRALRRLGSSEHLPSLIAVVERARTPLGSVEFALDAIELISAREGLPLPAVSPPPRLIPVAIPPSAVVCVMDSELVQTGRVLARTDTEEFRAPCVAAVAAIEPACVLLRRRAEV